MTEDKKLQSKNKYTLDWFVRGVLTKLGETFDRLTGRNWKPSSSLATSQLIEKLKAMLDAEAKDLAGNGKFVPHHIELKMQWDKFSTDAETALKKLEYELLTAAIDHINDRRYHTYAPMLLEIKPDYFTEGVKLSASFDKFAEEKEDNAPVNITVPDLRNVVIPALESEKIETEPEKEIFVASFISGNQSKQINLAFSPKERKSVGRTKENDLALDDTSVSKLHAALVLDNEGHLIVADTGSTNGTFVNGERIAIGKAAVLKDSDKVSFGTVNVEFQHVVKEKIEDESVTRKFSVESAATTNKNFSNEENVRLKNRYSTKVDFPSGADSIGFNEKATDEIVEDKS